jgi:hypothetical protein
MTGLNLIPGFVACINHMAPLDLEIACSGIILAVQFDHPKEKNNIL